MTLNIENFSLTDLKLDSNILGEGAFGKVYSGTYKPNGLRLAIKRASKKKMYQYGTYLIKAFFKELECMQKCSCENSVKFYFNFETENNYNIIMELCDGDLNQVLSKREKGFSIEEVKRIMSQLNNAFRKLKENNLIHRDLKLLNILIKYTDESKKNFIPKLCDYGFTKELKDEKTGTLLGTLDTMAPEILKNQRYNYKVDLWSVGVIIYELLFKEVPYRGINYEQVLRKIQSKIPIKKTKDPVLDDLISKLLEEDPEKRLTWDEYLNHPFFATEGQTSSTNIPKNIGSSNPRYKFIKDFDVGFKNNLYKCYVAFDQKKNINVIIKSYSKDFIISHEIYFKTEMELSKAFKGNEYTLQLINIFYESDSTNLVYNYIESENLSTYVSEHDMTEEELQKINKELFEHIFIFNECNFKSFIFISIYSFIITKEGKPILFDFGLSKFFLSTDELLSYYAPNKEEVGNTSDPNKTNVMNYGMTLLKCFYGNNLKIKIDNISFDLPKNKSMSKTFSDFVSECVYRNITKRSSWSNLNKHKFVKELCDTSQNSNTITNVDKCLFNNEILEMIFEIFDNKFSLINKYYDSLELNEKTEYIKEIEIFLLLTLFEQLMIFYTFSKGESFTAKQEISFITISSNGNSRCNINFANPIFKNMRIFDTENNETISSFLSKLKKHINKLKEISLNVHKITKSSLAKGNYNQFIEQFMKVLESSKFHDYLFSIVKKATTFNLDKVYDKSYKEINIAKSICECILFVKESVFESNKERICFNKEELIKQLNDIFGNKVDITRTKTSYVIISFLGVLFRYFQNMRDINQYSLEKTKSALDGLFTFYPSLMKLLNDCQKNLNAK